MALSFWFEIIVGWVLLDLLEFLDHDKNYWYATAHPFSRLPVFFMGICAGVLCVRIQSGDLDALRCKQSIFQAALYYCDYYISFWNLETTGCLTLKCAIVNGSEGWKDQFVDFSLKACSGEMGI